MLSLAFTVVFLFCLALAVAAVLLIHDQLSTYNASVHKFYFYYLVAFYAFSIYGIWGQILIRVLLAGQNHQNALIENVAGFLPVLGVPFLFVSWIMLVNLTYSLFDFRPGPVWVVMHLTLLMAVFAGSWWVYSLIGAHATLEEKYLKFAEIAVLFLFELLYYIILSFVFINLYQKQFRKGVKYISRFWILMNLGVLIRVLSLGLGTINDWSLLLAILLYFLSNFIPIWYLRRVSDHIFEPVKATGADAERITFMIRKFGITKRECEVIMQICDGKTNQQIADDLFISLQTVKDHTHRIYSKIGIKSRMQLVQKLNS